MGPCGLLSTVRSYQGWSRAPCSAHAMVPLGLPEAKILAHASCPSDGDTQIPNKEQASMHAIVAIITTDFLPVVVLLTVILIAREGRHLTWFRLDYGSSSHEPTPRYVFSLEGAFPRSY